MSTAQLLKKIDIGSAIVKIDLQRDNGLLAFTCDDLVIRVLDTDIERIVREFTGARGKILDMAWSPDCRWLISSSIDGVIRTYDMPTGALVDVFRVPSIATSLTFSPTGDFLATSHVDSVAISLWANRAHVSQISLRSISETDVALITMPGLRGLEQDNMDGNDMQMDEVSDLGRDEEDHTQLIPVDGLLTLSALPRSKWQTLINLETIKVSPRDLCRLAAS